MSCAAGVVIVRAPRSPPALGFVVVIGCQIVEDANLDVRDQCIADGDKKGGQRGCLSGRKGRHVPCSIVERSGEISAGVNPREPVASSPRSRSGPAGM